MFRESLQQVIQWTTDHNRITLLLIVLLTGVMIAGIPQIDTESEAGGTPGEFDDIDRVETAQYIQDQYQNASIDQSNTTVQTVYVQDEDGDVLSKSALIEGLQYQQEIRDDEFVSDALTEDGIQGIENLVATRAAGDENATLAEQIDSLEQTSEADVEQLVGETITEQPQAQQFLPVDHDDSTSSTDRRMFVGIEFTEHASQVDETLYQTAEERSEDGFFVINSAAWNDYNDHFFGEMVWLVLPAALVLILLVLAFTYRDLVDVIVGMSGVVLSILWMFGLLGWLGVEAGIVSIVPVVLVTGLSIDFGFHIFNRYREERGEGEPIRPPMARGVYLVATALILVTVTAAIGFLSNLTNPLPLIRDLGVSITLGVISALIIFVAAVPALKISIDGLLERLGLDRRKRPLGHGTYLRPALEQSVTLSQRAAPVVLVVAIAIGLLSGVAWVGLGEESFQQADGEVADWKQQLPGPMGWETHPVPAQEQHIDESYQPASADDAIQSEILIQGDVTDEQTLGDIAAGVEQLDNEGQLIGEAAQQTPVTAMQSVAAENDSFAATFEQADSTGDGIPDRNLEALYDEFYAADSEVAERVIERTDGEYRSMLVTLSLDAGFGEADEVVPVLDDGAAVMDGDGDRTATVAGTLAINEAILDEIVSGILLTMAIALAAIIVGLMLVFRAMHGSATLGAVVAVPIALVVGLVVGGMYVLGIPLTLLTALLMSLVIGLGIDYNIHIGDRFADELSEGRSAVESLRAAVTGTGGALLGSTLTSAGAFATIALVPHPQLQSFGGIVVVALLMSFVVSVLVLPSMLLLWSRYTSGEVTARETLDAASADD